MEVENYFKTNFTGILNYRNWGGSYNQIIEIYTPETNKGNAIKFISSYFNIGLDYVIAFGDGENDVEMIDNAKFGVAMKNAVPNVKKVAKYHTLSNTDNGVSEFLKDFFNIRLP